MYLTIKELFKRYFSAEIFATFTAMLGAIITFNLTNNKIISAYVGTISEGIGFYSFIVIRDISNSVKADKELKKKYNLMHFLKDIRNIVLEFGFSEFFDFLIIRPFSMYIFTLWISNYGVGILVGKAVADIIFYIPTAFAYQLERKYLK